MEQQNENAIILLRVRNPNYDSSKSIKTLLKQLGLPREVWDTLSFWNNSRQNLEYILYDARAAYRQLAKKLHPRLHTDSEEAAKKLHSLMREVEKRFDDHLNPKLITRGMRRVPVVKKPPVEKRCLNPVCGKRFTKTGQGVKKYCSKECCNYVRDRRNNGKKVKRRAVKVALMKKVKELRKFSDNVFLRDGRIFIGNAE
jgi:hypothetical protein